MLADELRKQQAVFAAVDAVALLGAFAGALRLHDPSGAMAARLIEADRRPLVSLGIVAVSVLWLLVFRACDLYRMRNGGMKEAGAILKACTIAALLTQLGSFLAHLEVSRLTVLLGYLLSIPFVIGGRALTRTVIRRFYANPRIAIPLLLVGFNPIAQYLCDQIVDQMTPYEPVGFLDDSAGGRQHRGYPVLGPPERLSEIAALYRHLEVAIVMPEAAQERQGAIIRLCESHRLRWWIVPWIMHPVSALPKAEMLGAIPLIGPYGSKIEGLNYAAKRAFDIVASCLLLILLAPVLAAAALAVWLLEGPPILFRQTRIGIHGRSFKMLKLRTMTIRAGDAIHRQYVQQWIRQPGAAARNRTGGARLYKLGDDQRITPVGRLLRRFSIDELPQLLSVLRGDMSLIGPRPALPYELELYQLWHRRRLDAPPGITGLWQVSGRNQLSFDEMVRLDVEYLENWSFLSDLKILARTVPVLLRGQGV